LGLEGGAEAGMAEEAGGCWCGKERECREEGEEEGEGVGNEWKGEHRRELARSRKASRAEAEEVA